jgi:hypothetical protein
VIPIDRRRRPDVGTTAPGRAGRTASEHPHAACRDQDPTLWDTDHVEHGSLFHRCRKCLTALAVCGRCPVRRRCADEATATPDVYTIRGGWPMVPLVCHRMHPVRTAGTARQPDPVLFGHLWSHLDGPAVAIAGHQSKGTDPEPAPVIRRSPDDTRRTP